jgi:hypothetical protein
MKMLNKSIVVIAAAGLAVGVAVAASSSAYAVPTVEPNGSLSGGILGTTVTTTTTDTWNIGTGTSTITLTGGNNQITGFADPYLGTPNNLLATNGGTVTTGNYFTLSNNVFSVFSGTLSTPLTLTVDSYTFTYTSELVTSLTNGNIGLAFLGDLTADTTGVLITPAAADLSVTFTEAAPTGSIGVAYSIDTPPNPTLTPEPASMLMLGGGLVSLGAVRRRRKAQRLSA